MFLFSSLPRFKKKDSISYQYLLSLSDEKIFSNNLIDCRGVLDLQNKSFFINGKLQNFNKNKLALCINGTK